MESSIFTDLANGMKLGRTTSTLQGRLGIQNNLDRFAKWSVREKGEGGRNSRMGSARCYLKEK